MFRGLPSTRMLFFVVGNAFYAVSFAVCARTRPVLFVNFLLNYSGIRKSTGSVDIRTDNGALDVGLNVDLRQLWNASQKRTQDAAHTSQSSANL
eukprot:5265226-Pleurochrysis_carterae.AAC.2